MTRHQTPKSYAGGEIIFPTQSFWQSQAEEWERRNRIQAWKIIPLPPFLCLLGLHSPAHNLNRQFRLFDHGELDVIHEVTAQRD